MCRFKDRFSNRSTSFSVMIAIMAIMTVYGEACYFDTSTHLCEINGITLRCKAGQRCAAQDADAVCVDIGGCGDGEVDFGEECDDGNRTSGDGCDGNCTWTGCGNRIMTTGEICDDGNKNDGDGCDSNCMPTGCHNGVVTAGEMCDDGNLNDDDECVENCIPAECGDGHLQSMVEECDDGDAVTNECAYGASSCTVCDERCRLIAGKVRTCGDGVVQHPEEVCDDGNSLSCGTCSSDCKMFGLNKATGEIVMIAADDFADIDNPNDPNGGDHDTFTLSDDINMPGVTFEFSKDDVVAPGNIKIPLQAGDSAAKVRDLTIVAIKNTDLKIQADAQGSSMLTLTHHLQTARGNKLITHTVTNGGFGVDGMAGGAGADCGTGVGCKLNADCLSDDCDNSTGLCE